MPVETIQTQHFLRGRIAGVLPSDPLEQGGLPVSCTTQLAQTRHFLRGSAPGAEWPRADHQRLPGSLRPQHSSAAPAFCTPFAPEASQ